MWRGDDEERVIQVHVVTIDIACSNTTGRCGVVMTRRELFRFTWSLSILPVVTRLVDVACTELKLLRELGDSDNSVEFGGSHRRNG
ncbi:hypothetical protein J6590_079505 [Homalodisca vitripennis]|nr:hypothetical protein J6590_079505 [Homalodisca vitripennis]